MSVLHGFLKRVLVYRQPWIPSSSFWSFALANMVAVVALATRGVRAIRRTTMSRAPPLDDHRRLPRRAFLGAYVVSGSCSVPRTLALWSSGARLNLWVHESFVTWRARRRRRGAPVSGGASRAPAA